MKQNSFVPSSSVPTSSVPSSSVPSSSVPTSSFHQQGVVIVVPTRTEEAARPRPRVEGERELEILEAALASLGELGYDKLSFDAVAQGAKASKATLYRR